MQLSPIRPCWTRQVSERFKATDIGKVSGNKYIGSSNSEASNAKACVIKSVNSKNYLNRCTFGHTLVYESVDRNQSVSINTIPMNDTYVSMSHQTCLPVARSPV